MHRAWKRLIPAIAVALLAPAGTAFAAGTSTLPLPTTTTPTPTPKPKPKAAPAKGAAKIFLPGIYSVSKQSVTVPGRPVRFNGVVRPYVAGQWVTVKATMGKKTLKHWRLRVKPSKGGSYGQFSETVKAPSAGGVTITVSHDRTAQQVGFKTTRSYSALDTRVGPGSRGSFVQLVQQRLAALHFWIPQTGVYDSGTELAVDAYHRLLKWGTYTTLDGRTISYLMNGWGEFKVRYPHNGRHAEGNLSLQVLALIDGSKVDYLFPISSGKPSTPTILGNFKVYSRVPGYLPDGMYYSDFFIRGYAIHGYDPAPDYPASHGCMRLPIQDAIPAFNWLALGDWVDVYY
ncbi:MAG TPA: L,D-transpeptidase [Solirubrobacteraceae bacterium]|jgi:hypothetical protein